MFKRINNTKIETVFGKYKLLCGFFDEWDVFREY